MSSDLSQSHAVATLQVGALHNNKMSFNQDAPPHGPAPWATPSNPGTPRTPSRRPSEDHQPRNSPKGRSLFLGSGRARDTVHVPQGLPENCNVYGNDAFDSIPSPPQRSPVEGRVKAAWAEPAQPADMYDPQQRPSNGLPPRPLQPTLSLPTATAARMAHLPTALAKHGSLVNGEPLTHVEGFGAEAQAQYAAKQAQAQGGAAARQQQGSGSGSKPIAVWEEELVAMLRVHDDREKALLTPGPTSGRVQCIVRGTKGFLGSGHVYTMYLENGEHFLMAARKRKKVRRSTWVLSRHVEDLKRDSDNCIAKLKSNVMGTEYNLQGKTPDKPSVAKGYAAESLSVHFKQAFLAQTGPRTLYVGLPTPGTAWRTVAPGGADSLNECVELARRRELPPLLERKIVLLCNKPPEYDDRIKAHTLDFGGRVKAPSVKNFQLVPWNHNSDAKGSDVVLQFGRVSDDAFILDFAYPLSAELAFAIALASIDTKLCYAL